MRDPSLPPGGGTPPDFPTWDHILPISRGGTNASHNRVVACHACNQRKGDRTAEEYLRHGAGEAA